MGYWTDESLGSEIKVMLHKQPETREATLRSNHESNDIVLSDEFTDLDSGLTDYNFFASMDM